MSAGPRPGSCVGAFAGRGRAEPASTRPSSSRSASRPGDRRPPARATSSSCAVGAAGAPGVRDCRGPGETSPATSRPPAGRLRLRKHRPGSRSGKQDAAGDAFACAHGTASRALDGASRSCFALVRSVDSSDTPSDPADAPRPSPSGSAPTSCSSSSPPAGWPRCTSRARPTSARGRRSSPSSAPTGTSQGDKTFLTMLVDEARLASAIDHPSVVKVRELGFDGGMPFIVMDYVEGTSLAELRRELIGHRSRHRRPRRRAHRPRRARRPAGRARASRTTTASPCTSSTATSPPTTSSSDATDARTSPTSASPRPRTASRRRGRTR